MLRLGAQIRCNLIFFVAKKGVADLETWNNLIDKFDLLIKKIKLERTVTIAGRKIPPIFMGFALIAICIPIWGYLEVEGKNKLIGALVVLLMGWAVTQLGTLGLGDGVGEKPGSSAVDEPKVTDGHK